MSNMKFLGDWAKTKYVLVYLDDSSGFRLFAAGKRGGDNELFTRFMSEAKHFDSFEEFKGEYSSAEEHLDKFKCIEINEDNINHYGKKQN